MSSPARLPLVSLLVLVALILAQCTAKGSDELVQEAIEFTNQGKYDEALKSFLAATEQNPKNPEAFYGLGGIYNYKDRHQDAAEAFKTTIRLDPTHFNARYSLGFTYEKLGQTELAKEQYARYKA